MRSDSEALVIGAGPVGLVAALALAKRNVAVELVDEGWYSPRGTPSLLLHARSLELLDELGVAERLVSQGTVIERVAIYDGQEARGCLDLTALPRKFPFVLALPQQTFSQVMLETLNVVGIQARRKCGLELLRQQGDVVVARLVEREFILNEVPKSQLEWCDVDRSEVRAQFVVGADGYCSKVRSDLGIEWVNWGHTQGFAICEFESIDGAAREATLVMSDGCGSSFWPMPGSTARACLQTWERLDELARDATLRLLVRERAPWLDEPMQNIQWAAVTHFERMLAARFGKGRVWLAGDAAHVTGPGGMQSVNAGIWEACELARYAEGLMKGRTTESALSTYEQERQEEWRELLGIDCELRAARGGRTGLSAQGAELVPWIPAAGSDLHCLLAQVGLKLGGCSVT